MTIAITLALSYKLFVGNVYFLQDEYQFSETSYNFTKIIYWFINGVLMYLLIRNMQIFCATIVDVQVAFFFRIIAEILLPFIYTLILVSILINSPGGLVGAVGRLYNLGLCICLIVLAFRSNTNKIFILSFSSFLIIDQVRIVLESLTQLEMI
jgi:hypothetical protein